MKKLDTKPEQQPDFKLDTEEQTLLKAFEAGELKSTSQSKSSILHKYASGRLLEKPSNLARNTG